MVWQSARGNIPISTAPARQPLHRPPACKHKQQPKSDAASQADGIKAPHEIAALDGGTPDLRIGYQRVHRVDETWIARVASERSRFEMDGQIVLLENPAGATVLAAQEASVATDEDGRRFDIGGNAADVDRGLGQAASQPAPSPT